MFWIFQKQVVLENRWLLPQGERTSHLRCVENIVPENQVFRPLGIRIVFIPNPKKSCSGHKKRRPKSLAVQYILSESDRNYFLAKKSFTLSASTSSSLNM